MSRLDSSFSQILGTDGDGRRKALIDYITQQPLAVRTALLIPDDVNDSPVDRVRRETLVALAAGWPDSGYQIDPSIMVDNNDPLTTMKLRQSDGFTWVPAFGMASLPASATGIATADPDNVPKGAIIVTTDFSTPNTDAIITNNPLRSRLQQGAVGTTYWPKTDDESPELSVYYQGDIKYQKLSVILDGHAGVGELLWVRVA